jgi:arabinofuranan 3-O-arabinosyltransferase
VAVSSAAVPDPRGSGAALVDGDPATAWVADEADGRPTITLSWLGEVTVDRLRLTTAPGTAASLPLTVTVSDGTVERTVPLDEDGVAEFPALTTGRLELSFPLLSELGTFDPYSRSTAPLGVGAGELELDALPSADPATPVLLPCGQGPVVTVDGEPRATSLQTTLGALRSMQPVNLLVCAGEGTTGRLTPGEHRLVAESTDVFAVTSATLADPDAATGSASARTAAEVTRWGAEQRTVEVGRRGEPTLLVVPENENAGWVATLDGQELEARTVDGWQQGYLLPAGPVGEVHLEFRPGATYRTALAGGAAAVVLLVVLLLLPVRRPVAPTTGRRPRAGVLALLVAAAGLLLLAGPAGLGAVAVAAGLVASAPGARVTVVRWLAGGSLTAGGLVTLLLPADAGRPAGQVMALLAVGALVASLLPASPGRSATTARHRRSGRSRTA